MKLLLSALIVIICSFTSNAQWLLKFQTIHPQIIHVMSSPNDSVCWFITNMDSLYKTSDGGMNWVKLPPSNVSFNPYGLFVLNNDTAFKSSNGDLYKTIDGGLSWSSVFTGTVSQPPVMYMKDNFAGVLTSGGLIYKTTDGGNTWSSTAISQPPSSIINSSGKGTLWVTGDTIWVLLSASGAAVSPDFGITWNLPSNNGLPTNNFGNISFSNTQFGIAVLHNSSSVYVTTDGANNWTPRINTLGANQDVLAVNSDLWFIPNPADHFYIKYSGDSGTTWTQQLMDAAGFEELEKSRIGNTIWTGTDRGTVYANTSQLSADVISNPNIKFSVDVFPNPFTSQALITISEAITGTIILSDISGKEIKKINLSGSQYVLDRGKLSNGIYYLKITDRNKNMVNRKILIQ